MGFIVFFFLYSNYNALFFVKMIIQTLQ